jgi:surface antigen
MKKVNMKSIQSVLLLGLSLVFLTNCSSINRTHIGAASGGATGIASCVAAGAADPYVTGACAIMGGFLGAELLYQSDYDVHNAVFVDHLNVSPNGSSYTNWYNKKTGNSGIIHVSRSYLHGPFKCKDYDATVDITSQWPLIGIGGVNREVVFGTACQLPDGRWIEKP